jgi:hypothetical protein
MNQVWDPVEIGPLDRCLRCWSERSPDFGFCLTCGNSLYFFSNYGREKGLLCRDHPQAPAAAICCWCAEPVCQDCIEAEGLSFVVFQSLSYCRKCRKRAAETDRTFMAALQGSGCCIKHRNEAALFKCSTCTFPLCEVCTYFKRKGIFRVRIGAGPFCLGCFRIAYSGSERRFWISGREALAQSLVSSQSD